MSCICYVTNLLFLRKTTLATLEVEYVDRGHRSVALPSIFSGHCSQRQKILQTKLLLWKTEVFFFGWRMEQSPQQKKQQHCVGSSCMWLNEWMRFIFSTCEALHAITLLLFSFMPTVLVFLFHISFCHFLWVVHWSSWRRCLFWAGSLGAACGQWERESCNSRGQFSRS